MFNKYFYDQFPNTSTYDINIDFSNDPMFVLRIWHFSRF